jgi:hypothetical protein
MLSRIVFPAPTGIEVVSLFCNQETGRKAENLVSQIGRYKFRPVFRA